MDVNTTGCCPSKVGYGSRHGYGVGPGRSVDRTSGADFPGGVARANAGRPPRKDLTGSDRRLGTMDGPPAEIAIVPEVLGRVGDPSTLLQLAIAATLP